MQFIKKNWHKLVLLLYTILTPVAVLYAQADPCPPNKICNPIKESTINGFIKTFLTDALRIGMPILVLAIIYCGFLFVAARGNTEKVTKAKETLLYTLIGAAVLLGSWAIATTISRTVNAL